ncbi:MAG TPA: ferritin-like domain-containing protein [Candidatus Acidoferrum sp.]|nr:ferritin-like domain-containing protein [Candidatus Acidoferrum sp.]
MKIDSLTKLLEEEIKDIYDFEKRLVRAIPKMAKAASSDELRNALTEHMEVTKNQVGRIEQVFEHLGVSPKAKPCAGMKGILEEGEETIQTDAEDTLLDVAIIGAAQRMEHYEMAAYASVRMMAEQLGNQDIVDLLQETWDEEHEADERLSEICEQILSGMGGEEAEEMGEDEDEPAAKPARRSGGGSTS